MRDLTNLAGERLYWAASGGLRVPVHAPFGVPDFGRVCAPAILRETYAMACGVCAYQGDRRGELERGQKNNFSTRGNKS